MKVSDQLHAPAALTPGKLPRYSLDRRLGEPHSRSRRRGEENILDTTEIRTPTLGRPVRSQPLYLLRYHGSFCIVKSFIICISSSFDGPGSLGCSRFRINLKTMNLADSWYDSLDGGSAHRKAANYTGRHKNREDADIRVHTCPEWS
jgi:hypothetical protein